LRKLILIKHASPQVQSDLPPEQWPLSDDGRAKCALLAKAVAEYSPAGVVSSEEVKALETGRIVAGLLGVPFDTAPDLHEHDRSNVPQMRTPEFISMMELLFRRPNDLVLGKETAVAALSRFRSALDEVLLGQPDRNVAVVSHGTVIALLLENLDESRKGYDVWRAMKLPSFAVLSLPGMGVERVVSDVGDGTW
jgi:2,3-bisphosphoglycerate-dependent phosphoglycerate mutase